MQTESRPDPLPERGNRMNSWFARIREGLFKDPSGKHRKRMGEAVWVYGYLHICANWETGQLIRTYKTIADETGIPESSVRKMMLKLKQAGYIKTTRLSQGLVVQITKWEPVKKKGRQTKYGLSENSEMDQIWTADGPNPARCTTDGPSPNGSKDKAKSTRGTTDGPTNETHNETQKKKESFLFPKSFDSKPTAGKKTNPDIKVAIDHYHDEFLRIHGFKPQVNGAAAKTFQRILKEDGRSIEEVKELTTDYLNLTDERLRDKGYPVEWLPGNINGLLLKKKRPKPEFAY